MALAGYPDRANILILFSNGSRFPIWSYFAKFALNSSGCSVEITLGIYRTHCFTPFKTLTSHDKVL